MTMASPVGLHMKTSKSSPPFITPQREEIEEGETKTEGAFPLLAGSTFRVGAHSNVKRVAGTIAHTTRQLKGTGEVCTLSAAGNVAINQAVKAIAIASQYLVADGMQCAAQPSFDPHGALHIRVIALGSDEMKDMSQQEEHKIMKVASTSDPYKVAGAVALAIRGHDDHDLYPFATQLAAQGANTVGVAVRAMTYTRGYILPDSNDLMFIPHFEHVKDGTRSLMMMNVFKTEVEAPSLQQLSM